MESISKNGKVFHGKFAETAVRLGLASASEDQDNVQGETPAQHPKTKPGRKSKK